MPIHQNLSELSVSVIEEYIELTRIAINTTKPEGGCFGYPALLLMLCVIDAISNHLGHPEHSFGALDGKVFDLNLNRSQTKKLKVWYRHCLAHNAMIAPGTMLSAEPNGNPIEFLNAEPVKIRLIPLFRIIEHAWKSFDKTLITDRNLSRPLVPIDLSSIDLTSDFGVSGCIVQPKHLRKI